jgi:hypothetical protein
MQTFDDYLDMYRVGDETLTAALDGRLAPQAHYETYFNVPFPTLRTGLNGLGDVGQALPRPPAATMSDGTVAPPAVWLQRALNILLTRSGASGRLVVDGVAGAQTLAATTALWTAAGGTGTRPYLVSVTHEGVSLKAVAMPRPLLVTLIDQINGLGLTQVVDPPGSRCAPSDSVRCVAVPAPGRTPGNEPPPEPVPASSGGMLIAAVAVVLGVWAATRG